MCVSDTFNIVYVLCMIMPKVVMLDLLNGNFKKHMVLKYVDHDSISLAGIQVLGLPFHEVSFYILGLVDIVLK